LLRAFFSHIRRRFEVKELRERYQDLKLGLAVKYAFDKSAYTVAKSLFIEAALGILPKTE